MTEVTATLITDRSIRAPDFTLSHPYAASHHKEGWLAPNQSFLFNGFHELRSEKEIRIRVNGSPRSGMIAPACALSALCLLVY